MKADTCVVVVGDIMAELIEPCVVIVTGSGSLAAMAVFERNFRKDMEVVCSSFRCSLVI